MCGVQCAVCSVQCAVCGVPGCVCPTLRRKIADLVFEAGLGVVTPHSSLTKSNINVSLRSSAKQSSVVEIARRLAAFSSSTSLGSVIREPEKVPRRGDRGGKPGCIAARFPPEPAVSWGFVGLPAAGMRAAGAGAPLATAVSPPSFAGAGAAGRLAAGGTRPSAVGGGGGS